MEGWGDMEIPYAVALDYQHEIPTAQDETVNAGVNRIAALVQARLNDLTPYGHPDD
jgi:hypothetical protein